MISIGVRSTPSYIYYSVVSGELEAFDIITCSKVIVPKALDIPDRLCFMRTCLLSILLEYEVTNAGIRTIENLVNPDCERIYIEGVIQELISNSTVDKYFTGKKSKIASLLGENVEMISAYIDGDEIFGEIEDWDNYCKEEKESIITAVAACCV